MPKFFFVVIIFVISGCVSSKSDDLSGLIQQRYHVLSSELPVQNGRFSMIKVTAMSENTLQLLIINTRSAGSSAAESEHFLSGFSSALCQESQSKDFALAGGKYQIVLQEEGRSPVSLFVDRTVCHYG